METFKKPMVFDTDKAWEKLHTRLRNEGLIETGTEPAEKNTFRPYMRIAAGFLLLIAAGTFLYMTMLRPQATKLFTLSNTEEQTLVKKLDDGSVVYLAYQSSISFVPGFRPYERRVYLKGEAFFDVAFDPDQPFIVEAANSTIQVVGTAFNVKSIDNRRLELFVEEGLVNIITPRHADEPLLVLPGELVSVDETEITRSKPVELTLTLWRQNRMHFKDESLDNIIQVINKNYGSNIVLENELLSQRRMTVTFYNNSIQAIVDLITLSMNLNATIQPDNSILLTTR